MCVHHSAGWDWQQPIRDRATGIWDAVRVRYTGPVLLQDVHVVVAETGGQPISAAASVGVSLELQSTGDEPPCQADMTWRCLALAATDSWQQCPSSSAELPAAGTLSAAPLQTALCCVPH